MTASISKPRRAITLRTYAELRQYAEAFGTGGLNLLILIGSPGIAKSKTIQQVVADRACWLEGNATPFGIYQAVYEHLDQPIVIDDVDSLYCDRAAVRLLKCLCQTDPVKTVAWHSNALGPRAEIPRSFSTTSRVCIIANEWKELNANISAVQDRGLVVFFEPTPEEIHRQVAEWFWDQVVFDWFGQYLHLIPEPSMRHYVQASELKDLGLDWVQVMLSDTVPEKALLVAKLKADPSYLDEADRVRAFQELGGGAQTTYYKWAKRIRSPVGTSALRLKVKGKQPVIGPRLRVVNG